MVQTAALEGAFIVDALVLCISRHFWRAVGIVLIEKGKKLQALRGVVDLSHKRELLITDFDSVFHSSR